MGLDWNKEQPIRWIYVERVQAGVWGVTEKSEPDIKKPDVMCISKSQSTNLTWYIEVHTRTYSAAEHSLRAI